MVPRVETKAISLDQTVINTVMKYPSKYSNGKEVSAAQYITELICEKRAKSLGKDLHYRFWLNKEWSLYYRNQIASANSLLKKYNEISIIRGLNNTKAYNIYSLRAPHLIPIIEQEQSNFAAENTDISIVPDRKEDKSYHKASSVGGILSKLKDIDNEH